MSNTIKWVLTGLISLAIFFIGLTFFEAFTAFFAAILIIVMAGGLYFAIDKYLITGFETFEELKKGNIAVGLYVLGYCILIGLCVIGSFVVYR